MPKSAPAWKQPERAHTLFLWLILWLTRLLGRWIGALLLYPIAAWYFLTAPIARRSSRDFLERVLPRKPGWRDSWSHLFTFASTILDRVLLFSGRSDYFEVDINGRDALHQHLEQGQGCLLILSHLGSFEMARVLGEDRGVPVRMLMDRSANERLLSVLESINPDLADSIIDTAGSDTDRVLRIKSALDMGEVVGIMADRPMTGSASARVQFLGSEVSLPLAPWLLADVLRVPVVLGFCCHAGGKRYDLYFENLSLQKPAKRGDRRAVAAANAILYAERLAHYAKLYPYNWFNFYPYWSVAIDGN